MGGRARLHSDAQEEAVIQIENSVILITGASSGIGEATARAAAQAGARLVLIARRGERLTRLAAELPDARAVEGDVTRGEDIQRAVAAALDGYGRIDALINNAGQGLHVPIDQIDPDDFRAILDLNLIAPLVAMQAVLPAMRRQRAGSIINVSSRNIADDASGVGAYAASESGPEQAFGGCPSGARGRRHHGLDALPVHNRDRVPHIASCRR